MPRDPKLPKGHDSWSSSTDASSEQRDYGREPRVGQSKPYSGGNAHGKREKARDDVRGGPEMPMSEPFKKTY